jgi:hypothetical protein
MESQRPASHSFHEPLGNLANSRRDFHIPTASATKADGKVENQKQVSHFPTAPVSLSQEQKNHAGGLRPRPRQRSRAASVVPFSSAPVVSCHSALDMSHMSKSNTFSGIDGYDWAKRSLPGLQDKLAAEYASGLMQAETSWPNEHIRRAVIGAQEGSLLAQNLVKHYQNQSLAEVKRTLLVNSASR